MFSRMLGFLVSFGKAFAYKETQAALPYVQAGLDELPADLAASSPITAFTATLHSAATKMAADPNVTLSLTGLLSALASTVETGLFGTQMGTKAATAKPAPQPASTKAT